MGESLKHVARVHRPTLTEEERVRRMEIIRQATIKLILSIERRKRNGDNNHY